MAISLVSNLQCSIPVSAISHGGEADIHATKKARRQESRSSSMRWSGHSKALHGERCRIGHANWLRPMKFGSHLVLASVGKNVPEDEEDEDDKGDADEDSPSQDSAYSEAFRQQMENMLNEDAKDAKFEGKDLAKLIRNKYGRSYDVRLIKKEFFGRQLLAMNVMWKYREQRSFPLTEEEYLLHLDDIAENLRGWGAVSFVRESLEKTRERPRIGKAVSIFINPDESGERSAEWINR